MTALLIDVFFFRDLRKNFGRVDAPNGLDLAGAPGRGARIPRAERRRKSTTIRVLLRSAFTRRRLAPDVVRRDPWRDAVSLHREIAYVPGDVTWASLSVADDRSVAPDAWRY